MSSPNPNPNPNKARWAAWRELGNKAKVEAMYLYTQARYLVITPLGLPSYHPCSKAKVEAMYTQVHAAYPTLTLDPNPNPNP